MSFLIDAAARVPQDANGREFDFVRAVKIFEDNNMLTLETSVNAFLEVLRTTFEYVGVESVIYVGTSGAASRLMVSYGYFQPASY